MKVTPQVVLALLDERDALNERLAELEADLAGLAEDQQKSIESIKQADEAVKLAHEKFSALAAENAALKQSEKEFNDFCREEFSEWEDDITETPATDAFLAEVRAQGVEMAMEHMQSSGSLTFGDCYISLNEFAAQLRKGVPS
ncbi:hypothetical protein PB916_001399 [Salmonella enterica]|nr:hypothetical protein [Salmonella enterica]EKI1165887.1 hypothetical protein [Salmonella enterica]